MKKDHLVFLTHILENIENIESFSKNLSKKELLDNLEKQYAIIRAVEIIGEAVKNIPLSLREKYHSVKWNEIARTRDKLIHQYFGVDLNLLWDIIKTELPILKKQIKNILEKES